MPGQDVAKTVAYCGLVCGVCAHAAPHDGGCQGCRHGGGPADCYQRECCVGNGLDGCWQCDEFPCDKGFFADDAWKGLCIASVQCIKDSGIGPYVDRLVSRLGTTVEYGEYRHKSPEQIRAALYGDPASG